MICSIPLLEIEQHLPLLWLLIAAGQETPAGKITAFDGADRVALRWCDSPELKSKLHLISSLSKLQQSL
ncbi:hypothetical protein CUC15_12555 [Oceanobacillus zhaokaii]|uniref:Uncharacterized protein n=1 Tax=Oceanobacillus zhaokaii TaxID=2052660 RepID=A0A345PI73_9BACI|nr:hypothetical protein CUC15_12555 [Oceanobacillus zhaokaii]